MTLILVNFITGLAWIWGVAMVMSFAACMASEAEGADNRAARAFAWGLPAWAWLIGRYLL